MCSSTPGPRSAFRLDRRQHRRREAMMSCRFVRGGDLDQRRLITLAGEERDRDRHGVLQFALLRVRRKYGYVVRLRLVQRIHGLVDDVGYASRNGDARDLEERRDAVEAYGADIRALDL